MEATLVGFIKAPFVLLDLSSPWPFDTNINRPPYDSLGDACKDAARQRSRPALKARGLPASSDVGTIAETMRPLLGSAAGVLGHRVLTAIVTLPYLVAVYQEDVDDALEYLGIKSGKIWVSRGPLSESSAAFAGNDFGLCADYIDICGCFNETYSKPERDIVVVLYTREALTVSAVGVSHAYYLYEPSYRVRQDWTLGSSALDSLDEAETARQYWGRVRELVAQLPRYPAPDAVFIIGESAQHPDLRANVFEGLGLLNSSKGLPNAYGHEPVYMAAFGAAELAKRSFYTSNWREKCYVTSESTKTPRRLLLQSQSGYRHI